MNDHSMCNNSSYDLKYWDKYIEPETEYEIVGFAGVWSCVHDHTRWSWEKKNSAHTTTIRGGGGGVGGGVYFNFITFPNIETTWHLI